MRRLMIRPPAFDSTARHRALSGRIGHNAVRSSDVVTLQHKKLKYIDLRNISSG
jgi:hypothetical protein